MTPNRLVKVFGQPAPATQATSPGGGGGLKSIPAIPGRAAPPGPGFRATTMPQTPGGNPARPVATSPSVPDHAFAAAASSGKPVGIPKSELSVPLYPPRLREFLTHADPHEAAKRMIEANCEIMHKSNAIEAWLSMLEWSIRMGADVTPGPLQPDLRTTVYPFDIGSLAGTTSSLGNQAMIDEETFLQAFIGGQFVTTSAVYANNPSRWNLRRSDRFYFGTEQDGSSSTLIGIGEEMFGNNLDHLAIMPTSDYFSEPDQVFVDVRNEGGTTYDHRALIICASRAPVEDDYMKMQWDAYPRWIAWRSGAFTNTAGSLRKTFKNPSRIFAFRMHAEPTAGSATATAVRVKIGTSRGYLVTKDWVVDQLLCGVTNQRTFFLTNPIYIPAGGSIDVAWSNDIDTTPASLSHNVAALYQEAKK